MASKKLFAGILMCLALAACERTNIGDVTSDPGRFGNKEINVAGKVTHFSIGALGKGIYQIDDGTGTLYVLAEKNGAPREGAYVGVKGHLMPSYTFMGKSYATVLRESDRRSVKSTD
jgi:hypothetical protein